MRFHKGLFSKYFALVSGLVSLALLGSGGIGVWFSYREAVDRQSTLQAEIVERATASVEGFLRQIEHDVAWPDLMLAGQSHTGPTERQNAYASLLRQSPAITDIAWVDPKGREVMHASRLESNTSRPGTPWASDPEFLRASKGTVAYSDVFFRLGSEPYIRVASPSITDAGWVTIVQVNLKFALEVIERIRVGKTGLAYVVDSRGILVSHPDVSLVLRRVSMSHLPQVDAALRAAQSDGVAFDAATDLNGSPVLTTHGPIRPVAWKVFVEIPRAEALAPLYTAVEVIVALLLVGIAVSLFATTAMARRMVRPIRKLQDGAERIGSGQLDYVIDVHTGDELESLAARFNQMSRQLQESYQSLEQKVQLRTHELTLANEALRIAKEEAEEAHRVKSNFLATINHEIRTPLNAMIGMAYLAMHSSTLDKARGYMSRMHVAGENLQGMVNSVLDYSKLEADKVELESVPFDLRRLLESARDLLGDRAAEKGIALKLEIDEALPKILKGDQVRLTQVINNLLSNAIKFTHMGEVTLEAAGTTQDDGRLLLQCGVRDSGIGMRPEQMRNLFRPFTQLDTSTTRKYGGTGLGLTICKRLVELMGGSITVESEWEKGSVFRVEIPFELPLPPQV